MATAIGPVRPGFPQADAATAHDEMKRLRNMLLAVGLEELQTPESYDASEDSDESDVPTEQGGRSKYMYFAFTDEMQADAPIYIGVRLSFDKYFNTHSAGKMSRVMEAMVSRELVDGVPSDLGALFSFSPGGFTNSDGSVGVLDPITSQGDFVLFSNGTLFIAFGVNSQNQVAPRYATYWGPKKCSLFMILARTGKNVSVFMDRRGYHAGANNNVTQTVLPAELVSPFSNTYINKDASVFTRAGNILFDGGTPVVAPIFGRDEYDNVVPLRGVYTIPAGARADLITGQILRLDFTGEEKDYLYFHTPSALPANTDQRWLIEWQ